MFFIIENMSSSSAEEFNNALINFLRTLSNNIRSETNKHELNSAIVLIEAVAIVPVMREEPKRKFNAHMLELPLVNAIRQRSIPHILEQIKLISERVISEALQKDPSMAEEFNDNSMLKALANITPQDIDDNHMPWNLLAKVYKLACGMDVSHDLPKRVYEFNRKYGEFVQNMACAFPSEEFDVNADYRRVIMWNPQELYDKFKVLVEPYFECITNPSKADDVFASADTVFAHLPIIRHLPLHDYWQVQVLENEVNRKYLSKAFIELLVTMAGLPSAMFNQDLITSISSVVEQELDARQLQGEPSQAEILAIAMSTLQKIQENGMVNSILGAAGGPGEFDLDHELLTRLTQNMEIPDDMRLALEMSSVTEQPIFESQRK